VHVVTVNDYLARRDAAWMGKVYEFLGLSFGVVVPSQPEEEKAAGYAADVTYCTNNELGFDYLRDNMKSELSQMRQRDHFFAIVDEVDSILVDEARVPLIISGPTDDKSDLYVTIDKLIPALEEVHYEIDEKARHASLTEDGNEYMEQRLHAEGLLPADATLYDPESTSLVHHVNQALVAHKMYKAEKDYIVRGQDVILIDEFTGRMMTGRRLSNGLHQALEAKENVSIQPENVTLASVTFQNYFRLYEKLGGMTGTAMTEADEFMEIYGLGVVEVPTNVPVARVDEHDRVYRTAADKYAAVVESIKEAYAKGQPVLVGTTSIEKSEEISAILKKDNIKHNVLNARFHEQEAEIIADAGIPGAVTIATNMAGRGTDIQLGGNLDAGAIKAIEAAGDGADPVAIRTEIAKLHADAKKKALDAGGLYVLATERHESRRIDNQLRGRSGRQGDPGRTTFFLSLEDDLMRIFNSGNLDKMLQRLGMKEGEAIVHPWVNKALERAQAKVEARNFDIRKNLLKFDDVMNQQRKNIFAQRRDVMASADQSEVVHGMRQDVVDDIVAVHIPPRAYPDQWNMDGLYAEVLKVFGLDLPIIAWGKEEGVDDEVVRERLYAETDKAMAQKAVKATPETMRRIEKQVLLQAIDKAWREHLLRLEHLRSVIGFRSYAQRDPLNEYKSEAFTLFEALLDRLRVDVTTQLAHIQVLSPEEHQMLLTKLRAAATAQQNAAGGAVQPNAAQPTAALPNEAPVPADAVDPNDESTWGRTGRNDSCPCGSGKKYKHCHGKV